MNIKINEIKMTPPTAFTPGQVIEEQEVISPSMLALQELQETTGAALYETMEEIGMALSGKLRESYKFTDAEKLERRQQALLRLINKYRRIMEQRCVRLPKRIVILIYRMRIKLSLLQWRLLPAGCQKEKTRFAIATGYAYSGGGMGTCRF